MHILIVGFGGLARDLSDKIKHFPEYGLSKDICIYHIFVRRNSLSYGKNLVVEIPDPHGDGYRTYKDGLQALDDYSTTVSSYKPWLLEEAAKGSFHVLLDCTPKTTESYSLISEILKVSAGKCTLIPANIIGIDATIEELRKMLDGGKPWTPVEYTDDFNKKASDAWQAAQTRMVEYHNKNRLRDIAARRAEIGNIDISKRKSCFAAIPDFDRDLIDRFVIKGDPHSEYLREEIYDSENKRILIKHDILDKFFGWHHTEQLACVAFLNPFLEIDSAIYVKYLEDTSNPLALEGADYVVEYVHRGTINITDEDESRAELVGGTAMSSYSYMPNVNPPAEVSISAGTEIIIFTYKEKIK